MATAALLALVAAACTAAPGRPAVGGPDVETFDEALLIDVLPPDGIAAIDRPEFESLGAAAEWLDADDPVIALEVGGEARAYPLAILMFHEIVNDEVGGTSVAVTFCPLCNSAIVYERTVGGRTLDFGVSGKLYQSDLVMYDRATDSLWPQIMGRAVLGDLKGTELVAIPSSMTTFGEFSEAFPRGRVLARPGARAYGSNPYTNYDSGAGPFGSFFSGDSDERLEATERVVGVSLEGAAIAYPFGALAARGKPAVVHDRVGETDLVVFWGGGARSALDSGVIAEGRTVGSSGVFAPRAGGRDLSFTVRDGVIVDRQTGSSWNLLGQATAGPLEGKRLNAIHHLDAFWFAWAAFVPFTQIWNR